MHALGNLTKVPKRMSDRFNLSSLICFGRDYDIDGGLTNIEL